MAGNDTAYHEDCAECENLRHCFGAETAERIRDGDTDGMVRLAGACRDFYPEVKG